MDRTPVRSSNIGSIGYNGASSTLEVEFHSGGLYQYSGGAGDHLPGLHASRLKRVLFPRLHQGSVSRQAGEVEEMIVKALHVKNFRSILDERIDCDNLTVLVGRNGTGKSSFLRAWRCSTTRRRPLRRKTSMPRTRSRKSKSP